MSDIANNIALLKTRIHECEIQFHRQPNSVALLAVSKGQPLEKILQAIAAGQLAFGENYLQEALIKITALQDYPLEWHFIGPIQSNKTKKIAENFNWVHSVDNINHAKRLNDQRPDYLPPLNICIQVNISHEATKSGVEFDSIFTLADYCLTLPRLQLRGLMTIPAYKQEVREQRAEFQKLTILYELLREKNIMLDTLSMGMSNDWEAAVAEGATLIRIGSLIFGARN